MSDLIRCQCRFCLTEYFPITSPYECPSPKCPKSRVMTNDLEIASRILANSDILDSGLSRQESLIKESIAVSRKTN